MMRQECQSRRHGATEETGMPVSYASVPAPIQERLSRATWSKLTSSNEAQPKKEYGNVADCFPTGVLPQVKGREDVAQHRNGL